MKNSLFTPACRSLLVALSFLVLPAWLKADVMFSNLGESWTDPDDPGGEIQMFGPGLAFGQAFSTGPSSCQLSSITLEQYGFQADVPQFTLGLYRVMSSDPDLELSPVTELVNPTIDASCPAREDEERAFVAYTPASPVTLQANSTYVVAAFGDDAVQQGIVCTSSANYTGAQGWSLQQNLWYIEWMDTWLDSFEYPFMKLKVDGAPNSPPDVSSVYASPCVLWPPNGALVPIQVKGVTDPDGDPVSITITSIQQDEPVLTPGLDTTAPDGVIQNGVAAFVRSERLGTGNGRVYKISFTASDGKPGGTAKGVIYVTVPHDQDFSTAVDDGPITGYYDSTAGPLLPMGGVKVTPRAKTHR